MKKACTYLFLILLLNSCHSLTSIVNVDYQDENTFINATYTVANRMKGSEYVSSKNYEEFQFTYIFASPTWHVEDFDMTQEVINGKYVDNWEYKYQKGHQYVEDLIMNIHSNKQSKILCSFHGAEFIEIASSPERRGKFAKMMAQFVKKFNYDGIELDWEATIKLPEHLAFMKDIRNALTELNLEKPLYVATALHSDHRYTQAQATELSNYVDWINIMTYDMGGGYWGSIAAHNTPLDKMKEVLKHWSVFSPKKLCIGLASYGYAYRGIKPNQELPEGEKLDKYGRDFSYTQLPALLADGWFEQWDSVAECPYYFSPDSSEFLTVDSERSINLKVDWILESGYKGLFWWEFHTDWIAPTVKGARGTHLLMDYVTDRKSK